MIVVDASLIVKTVIPEPGSDAALEFVAKYPGELAASDLLLSEVANAIVRRANMREASLDDSIEALEQWSDAWRHGFVAPYRLSSSDIVYAGQLAMRLGHPLSDCIYLALAIELGCELATCDHKFARKAQARYPQVRLLESLAGK